MDKYLFRYQDTYIPATSIAFDIGFELKKFKIIKETPCGFWIAYGMFDTKWVSKTARNRFAFLLVENAAKNYIQRKIKQGRLLKNQLRRTTLRQELIKSKV